MANIPKKALDRFIRAVPRFQKVLQIAKDRDVNESDTVSVINDIFAEVFGYDKYLEIIAVPTLLKQFQLVISFDPQFFVIAQGKSLINRDFLKK